MKALALLILTTMSLPLLARDFAGLQFHSTVPNEHVELLSHDLKYLYQHDYKKQDTDLKRISGILFANGPDLHNWLLNRVHYIVGEDYDPMKNRLSAKVKIEYPKTPLPPAEQLNGKSASQPKQPIQPSTPTTVPVDLAPKKSNIVVLMSNFSPGHYIVGKKHKLSFAMQLDGKAIPLTSPRMGLIKVGTAAFASRTPNKAGKKAEMNTIFRMATLFHEARHSDGSGESTGFLHFNCPEGHPYAGIAACEKSGNGSYTIGALSMRQLAKNCLTCTVPERTFLSACILDNFSRVLVNGKPGQIQSLKKMKLSYKGILAAYESIKNPLVEGQLNELKNKLADIDYSIESLLMVEDLEESVNAPFVNATPEGRHTTYSIFQTKRMMEESLK